MLAKIVAWGPDRAAALDRLDGARSTDRRPRRRHEPAVPALAGPPAGRARRRGADGHARRGSGRPMTGRSGTAIPDDAWAAAATPCSRRPTTPSDPWAGGWRLNAARSVRLEADGGTASSMSAAPGRPTPTARVRARRRHRPPRPRRPQRRLPSRATARRGRRGPGGRRARGRRRDRTGRCRRADAGRRPDRPRRRRQRGRAGRPDRHPRGDEDGARGRRDDRRPSRRGARRARPTR